MADSRTAAVAPRPVTRSGRSPMRRRQRSVRVTVAVSLLSLATAMVVFAVPTQSPLVLSIASVSGVVLAWVALRIMWAEVLQSRRENAADRAAAAKAYRELFSARAVEHAEFTTAMTERLAEAQLTRRDLEALLTQAQGRAHEAENRAAQAVRRVRELELAAASEEITDLAAWQDQQSGVPERVVS